VTTYPDPGPVGDIIDGTREEATWANAIRDRTVQRFTSASDRGSYITSPTGGMVSWTAEDGYQVYNDTLAVWQSFTPIVSAVRTAGDKSPNSTAYADVDNAMDLSLPCIAGDRIEFALSGLWLDGAVAGHLAVRSVTRAVDGIGTASGTGGVSAWAGTNGTVVPIGGGFIYPVVSGDIATGVAIFRLRVKCSAATTKILKADTAAPLYWHAKNLGQ